MQATFFFTSKNWACQSVELLCLGFFPQQAQKLEQYVSGVQPWSPATSALNVAFVNTMYLIKQYGNP